MSATASSPALADAPGSVAANVALLRGVWHDRLTAFHPDGTPMAVDEVGSVRGSFPYDNLVYIDVEGDRYTQTNVTFRGRPLHTRTFTARLAGGVLRFDPLGPEDPGHIGVAAGPGHLVFLPERLDDAVRTFSDPDYLRIGLAERTRVTTLYRDGVVVRTLLAEGVRLSPVADRRMAWDPRGPDGPVHDERSTTRAFEGGHDD
jgi:hypothetical protein